MAKKAKKVVEPQVEEVFEETFEEKMVEEQPVVRERLKSSDEWEIKDRMYNLKGSKKPLSRSIKSANIFYFDEEKGYERELKYCENQITSFVDEMKGDQRLSHIIFRNGALHVPKEKTVLQKLLSLYHPHRDKVFHEHKPKTIAQDELIDINLEVDALIAARNMDIDMAEAVMRAEIVSKVSKMSAK